MPRPFAPTTLMLGCGYTLTRLLRKLSPSSVLFTVRSEEALTRANEHVSRLYHGAVLSETSKAALLDIIDQYPGIDTIVDSVPPLFGPEISDPLQGVKLVCDAFANRPLKRVIYLSTTGVFGVEDGSDVDEKTTPSPKNERTKARFDSEQLYASLTANVTALRISAIYGPGRGLGTAMKKGSYKLISGQDRWSNRIHVEDLVELLKVLLFWRGIPPKIVCVADDHPTKIREVVKHYCEKFSLPMPPEVSEEEARKDESHTLLTNQRISNALMKSELLPGLKYPSYKEGAATEFTP